ncbi:histidine phosphatase family protein [Marinoscillum furvescens]|uniref:Putative phosphoglycerate mutase n=1 Tax=Marinoscillum furvescens DSM 4134 TaxID=1122208 RepID=A0A3D9KXS4_MARFU|nr:histidine phosphatase family protein [Marinoscillum furvescens]RED93895.1 putative phosphoglycerate mutase [Marinoscillum furvescens DSM 4134]
MKQFYIIRHGETEYNRIGMVQGSGIDAPLNETGEQQAEAFYQAYKDVSFDKIYTSNLIRTEQTVKKFIAKDIPHEALPGLREISWGVQEGVAFTPETSTEYQETAKDWSRGNLERRIEGGENPIEVAARQQEAFEHILAQPNEDRVLICTHGRAMRIMMCWMLKHPLSMMDQFKHTNTGLYVVNWTGSQFSIEVHNATEHLETVPAG